MIVKYERETSTEERESLKVMDEGNWGYIEAEQIEFITMRIHKTEKDEQGNEYSIADLLWGATQPYDDIIDKIIIDRELKEHDGFRAIIIDNSKTLITDGLVYVLNDNGKTIEKYNPINK